MKERNDQSILSIRKERGQRREEKEGERRKTGQERAISNKIEKSGSPLPTIKDRRNTYTTHIYSPSNPRMANGSVKFPISFPDQREYPTFPSPVSTRSNTFRPRSRGHTVQGCVLWISRLPIRITNPELDRQR